MDATVVKGKTCPKNSEKDPMSPRTLLSFLLLLAFALAACSPVATSVVTATVAESTVAASTSTMTAVPTATKTLVPTRTSVPTSTSTPPTMLQNSTYKVAAGTYMEIGAKVGNAYAYDKALPSKKFWANQVRTVSRRFAFNS